LPPVAWVEAAEESVLVVLDEAAPAPPGFTAAGADRWRSTATAGELSGLARGLCSPAPLLVALGTSPSGAEILVDVERHGVVTVAGAGAGVAGLLAAVATGAATAPWVEVPEVVVVGLDRDLHVLPAVTPAPTLAAALDRAESRVVEAAECLAGEGCAGTAAARASGAAPDAWGPLLVVSAEAPDDLSARRLAGLAGRGGHCVGVVCAAGRGPTVGRRVELGDDGELVVDGLDVAVSMAHCLGPVDVGAVADLMEVAAEFDDVAAGPPGEGLRLRPRREGGGATAPGAHLAGLVAEVDVLVRILGDVDVVHTGPGGDRAVSTPAQKELEAAVYLGVVELPPAREELEMALWPAGTSSTRTFHNVMSATRKLLGVDRDGQPVLGHAQRNGWRYAVSDRVSTDYGLLHELHVMADETVDAAEAASILAEALTLVRGEPFKGAANGYAWVSQHRWVVVQEVIDIADELAEVRLAERDWRGAEWAARRGLVACPSDERLYRQLGLAALGAGNLAAVRRVLGELFAAAADPDCGVEPEDTVHPETLAFFDELLARRWPSSDGGGAASRARTG
jgi:DNA-binding SARP family transcriptional activator